MDSQRKNGIRIAYIRVSVRIDSARVTTIWSGLSWNRLRVKGKQVRDRLKLTLKQVVGTDMVA